MDQTRPAGGSLAERTAIAQAPVNQTLAANRMSGDSTQIRGTSPGNAPLTHLAAAGLNDAAQAPVNDQTPAANPAQRSSQPIPEITGGDTAQNPIQSSALEQALTNNSDELGNKWIRLQNGVVQLEDYLGEDSFGSVFNLGEDEQVEIAESDGSEYFNGQLQSETNGLLILRSLGLDAASLMGFLPGDSTDPAAIMTESPDLQFQNSYGLTPESFQAMAPAQQTQVLDAISAVTDALAEKGYVLVDINPANFTIQPIGTSVKAVLTDPDMIMTMDQINQASTTAGSIQRSMLDGSLSVSDQSTPYVAGSFSSAQALENQLNIGLKNWLINTPPAQ